MKYSFPLTRRRKFYLLLVSVVALLCPLRPASLAQEGPATHSGQLGSVLPGGELPATLPEAQQEFVRGHSFDDVEFRGRQRRGISSAAGAPSASRGKEVRVIYLVPSDKPVRPDYVIAVQNAVLHVQAFYREQMLNGHAFSVHTPVVEVYQTGRASDFYSTGANAGTFGFWESVLADGFRLTGGGFNDPENRWIFYVDAPGGCGQLAGGGTAGVALMGHNDLRGLTGQSNIPQCPNESPDMRGVCRYVGGLGHELGHAFNLPHPPGCDQGNQTLCGGLQFESLMYLGYSSFPRTHLLDQDRASLMATGFFAPFNLETPGSSFCSSMTAQSPNPIDLAGYFVRWNYKDFLGREPDEAGAAFWTDPIRACGSDTGCVEVKRIDTSAAFFLSIEFQETGFLAYRTHKAAFGNLPAKPVPLTLRSFLADSRQLSEGVIVGTQGWPEQLEANKTAYFNAFVTRADFIALNSLTLTAEQYVDALFARAGVPPTQAERQAALNAFGAGGTAGRAAALRSVAESQTLKQAETNRAFVLMQYFGYLRRDPDAPDFQGNPDPQFLGYNFWLTKLDQFNGNYIEAEMVKAFITSIEYRRRFGQ